MTRDLPLDTEKALEAVAEGWTRTPTIAHPDCLCRVKKTDIQYFTVGDDHIVVRPAHRQTRLECPVHPPKPRRR